MSNKVNIISYRAQSIFYTLNLYFKKLFVFQSQDNTKDDLCFYTTDLSIRFIPTFNFGWV